MNRLAKAPTPTSKSDTLRLFAVVVAFMLVVLGGSWGGSTTFLNKSASNVSGQVFSETLRHAALASVGRITIDVARPSAKKSGFRGPDVALPTGAGTFAVGAEPGGMRSLGGLSARREPAPQGYLARAPPALG